MSDNEIIVSIEPELLDFETRHRALGNVDNCKPWQLPHGGLINGHKIGKSTALQLAMSRAGAGCCHD
jgi:hypothetical protein